jgi:tetraacyldisaccharide 4'-kinase
VESQAGVTGLPVFGARLVPEPAAAAALKGKKILAFAGIGRPEKFFETLKESGAEIVERRSFDDHHRFTSDEARELLVAAKTRGLLLVTTEKDFARMQGDPALAELAAQATALPVRLMFDDVEGVRRLLERTLRRARTQDLARPA